jgi:hypothetical protein
MKEEKLKNEIEKIERTALKNGWLVKGELINNYLKKSQYEKWIKLQKKKIDNDYALGGII